MLRYAITQRLSLANDEPARHAALIGQASRLASEGVDLLQLRERDLEAGVLTTLAHQLLTAIRANSPTTRLLINSRADIAVAAAADGVHLSSAPGSLTPTQVRALYAAAGLPSPVLSLSCHTVAEVARAAASTPARAPTHILFGPVFEKVANGQHVTNGLGLDLLRQACLLAAPIPVLALGGVTGSSAFACVAAGAAGIASIRLFAAEADQVSSQREGG